MDEQKYTDLKKGEFGAKLSIVAYLVLSCLKFIVGFTSQSQALRADALNNTTDIIASIAVLIGLKISQRPPDQDHAYGHWKSEGIASLVASFIMFTAGIQVLLEAGTSILREEKATPDMMAAYVGIISGLVMYLVYRYNARLAKKINSQSLTAAAKDNLSDSWVSIGTAIGIIGSQFKMPWLDTITAAIVGLLICKTAWEIFKNATLQLTDGFDEKKIVLYKETIEKIPDIEGIKEVKGRNYGNNTVLDIVITVQPSLNINQAHDISTLVEKTLIKEHDIYDVHVHVEPSMKNGL